MFTYAAPQWSLTHGGAALQVVAKVFTYQAIQNKFQKGGGGKLIIYLRLNGSSNISTYNWGKKNQIIAFTDTFSVKVHLCICFLCLLNTWLKKFQHLSKDD